MVNLPRHGAGGWLRRGIVSRNEELLCRIQAGDVVAEEQLVTSYMARVVRQAELRGVPAADAEEIAMDVLHRMITEARAGKLRAPTLRAWVKEVTKNEATDWFRRAKREREGEAAIAEELRLARDGVPEEENAVVAYPRVAVLQALRRIKEREEKTTRREQGWSYAQILEWVARDIEIADMARWMETSANTTRQRKKRALELLKDEVENLLARGEVLREKK